MICICLKILSQCNYWVYKGKCENNSKFRLSSKLQVLSEQWQLIECKTVFLNAKCFPFIPYPLSEGKAHTVLSQKFYKASEVRGSSGWGTKLGTLFTYSFLYVFLHCEVKETRRNHTCEPRSPH